MIGKKEWFTTSDNGLGLKPVAWQGWGYVVVFIAGMLFFAYQQFLPIAAETSYKLCLGWTALFMADTLYIWVSLRGK